MYQKDYILRMIEMIGDLIAAILGYMKEGEFDKAEESLNDAYYQFLKEDAAYFRNLKIDNLTDNLMARHNYTNGHLEILSELFFAEAELASSKGRLEQSLDFYYKSSILLEFVITESKTFSIEKNQKLETLKKKIVNLESK